MSASPCCKDAAPPPPRTPCLPDFSVSHVDKPHHFMVPSQLLSHPPRVAVATYRASIPPLFPLLSSPLPPNRSSFSITIGFYLFPDGILQLLFLRSIYKSFMLNRGGFILSITLSSLIYMLNIYIKYINTYIITYVIIGYQ